MNIYKYDQILLGFLPMTRKLEIAKKQKSEVVFKRLSYSNKQLLNSYESVKFF